MKRTLHAKLKEKYITAKTKDLQDFGYTTLTREHVEEQLDKLLNEESEGITVIGKFIEHDVENFFKNE